MSFLIKEGTTHVGVLKLLDGVYLRYFDETNTGFTYLTEAARQDGYVIATVPEFMKAHGIARIKQEIREKPLAERIKDTGAVDMVNEPPHYKAGEIECIDAIRAALTEEEFRGYCKGNILKYTWRERLKGGFESIKKAVWYANQIKS